VPAGPVLDSGDIFENEHLRARGMIVEMEHPERGNVALLGCPIRLSESPARVERAPLLGEHTAQVLAAELGYSEATVAALRDAGAIG
jgi:formyl-CoA transferase